VWREDFVTVVVFRRLCAAANRLIFMERRFCWGICAEGKSCPGGLEDGDGRPLAGPVSCDDKSAPSIQVTLIELEPFVAVTIVGGPARR